MLLKISDQNIGEAYELVEANHNLSIVKHNISDFLDGNKLGI